jgi:peptide/nickel transport system ATP-binding protein
VQAKILKLLIDLKKKFNLTYLFISHNVSVVEYMSDRVAVMYLGKIVESSSRKDIFRKPLHPYTISLVSAIPLPDPRAKKKKILLKGEVPSPINPPKGCRFSTRCPLAQPTCRNVEPALLKIKEGHFVACHYWEKAKETLEIG